MKPGQEVSRIFSYRRLLIVLAVCVGISVFLFYREFSVAKINRDVVHFTPLSVLLLLAALLMTTSRDIAYVFRIRLLTNRALSWRQSLNTILIWEFASAVTPGVVGGAAVAMFILEREKIPLGKSTALVIITAILDNFFYILLLPILFLFISSDTLLPSGTDQTGMNLFLTGYAMIALFNLVLISGIFFLPKLPGYLAMTIYKLPLLKRRQSRAEKFARDIEIASTELKGKSVIFWLQLFAYTIWSWTSRYLVINFVLLAFLDIGILDNLVILGRQLVMWLVMLVTPTPGGTGMAEYLFGRMLSDFIPNGALSISLALIWRSISYYPYLLIGSIILPRWIGKKGNDQPSNASANLIQEASSVESGT